MLSNYLKSWEEWERGQVPMPVIGALFLRYILTAFDKHATAHARMEMRARHPVFLECAALAESVQDEGFARDARVVAFFTTADLDKRRAITALRMDVEDALKAMRQW